MTFAIHPWLWLLPVLVLGAALFFVWSWRRRAALLGNAQATPLSEHLIDY